MGVFYSRYSLKYYSNLILKFTYIFFTSILLFVHISVKANLVLQQDTVKKQVIFSTDSAKFSGIDSLKTDTIRKNSKKGQINEVIKAVAADSSSFDPQKNILYLYGNARITYGNKEVDAGFIQINQKLNTIIARPKIDVNGKKIGLPIFKDPEQGALTADSVYYNFNTSKGKIYQVYTEQQGGFITGGKIKKQTK